MEVKSRKYVEMACIEKWARLPRKNEDCVLRSFTIDRDAGFDDNDFVGYCSLSIVRNLVATDMWQ